MTTDQIITIATGILEGGGIAIFLYFILNGLKKKIEILNSMVDMQSKTLEVMERRIEETKGIGELYKELLNEIPDDLKKYKDFIRESKDAMIQELKNTIEEKDQKHKEEIEKKLAKIHEQEKSINQLFKARDNIILASKAINQGMDSISEYYEAQSINKKINSLRSVEIYIQHKGDLNIINHDINAMKLITTDPNKHISHSHQTNAINVSEVI